MWHILLKFKTLTEMLLVINNNRGIYTSNLQLSIFYTSACIFIQLILHYLINNTFLHVNAHYNIQQEQTTQLEKSNKLSSLMPVIGGLCRLDSPDVHIGGKQTQFFLRCEPVTESASGEGVWVVKSHVIGSTSLRIPAAAIVKTKQQIQKTTPKMSSYICDLVSDAHEFGFCSVSENCLQPVYTDRNAFLQCDSTTRRWTKKHCQPAFIFDFERQACIAHTVVKHGHHHFRQFPETNVNLSTDEKFFNRIQTKKNNTLDNENLSSSISRKYEKEQLLNQKQNRQPSFVFLLLNDAIMALHELNDAPQNSIIKQTIEPKIAIELENYKNVMTYPKHYNCPAGFSSYIRCSDKNQCPIGLVCAIALQICCPISTKNLAQELQHKRVPKWMQIPNKNKLQKRIGRSCLCNDCLPCMPFSMLAADSDMLPMKLLTNDFCPGGSPPIASCSTTGACIPPMQCLNPGICCMMPGLPQQVLAPPSPLQPPPQTYACPGGLPVLGQCIGGRCMSPAVCSTPANICCAQAIPTAIPATVCPDGTQAAGACVNGQCGAGFTCNQGLCCSNSSQTPRCLDGSQSIGACIQGRCGTGYTCTTGNICCPSQLNPCPPGQVSIGLAVNGRCPSGYTLVNGQCCGAQSSQVQITCPQIDSSGPCDRNQQCSEPGYACDTANNWCCPQVFENEDPIGPCIEGEGGTRLCPEGYACVGDGEGECRRLDTGTCAPEEQLGPCGPNNECPAGYECIEGFCCRIDNAGRNGNTRYRRGATNATLQNYYNKGFFKSYKKNIERD